MRAGQEIGDHFMLNLYNKVIPQFKNNEVFLKIYSLLIFSLVVYMYSPKKSRFWISIFAKNMMG